MSRLILRHLVNLLGSVVLLNSILTGSIFSPVQANSLGAPFRPGSDSLPAAHPAATASLAQASLEQALNPDGTLNLTRNMQGSYNASGWKMLTDANGHPRFIPASSHGNKTSAAPLAPTIAGDEWWDARFQNGLTNNGFATDVYAVAVEGSDVYVGGSFSRAGAVAVNNIARWSSTTHQWYALAGGVAGQVYSIIANGSSIYVGGSFNDLNGQSAWSLGKWDTATNTWSLVGGTPGLESGGTFVGVVQAMALDGSGNLIVAGSFDHAGSVPAINIARWSGSAWTALGNGLGLAGQVVLSLAVSGSDVFAGGSFTTPESYIAHWNGSSWIGMGGTNGPVLTMTLNGSNLYAGGQFTMAGGTMGLNHIGLWTGGTNWLALGTGSDSDVTSIALGPGGYYVGGNFLTAGGNTVNHVAFWNGSAWSGLGAGVDNEVYSLAVVGTAVYVGGTYTYYTDNVFGNNRANALATWDPTSGWRTLGNGAIGIVYALAISGSDVYIGGSFDTAGGVPVNNIAHWNSKTGAWDDMAGGVLGCTAQFFCVTSVLAIAVNGSNVFVGGNFTAVGGQSSSALARYNTQTNSWVPGIVGVCLGANCQAIVYALAPEGSGVVAGGNFVQTGCFPVCQIANNVTYWDGAIIYIPLSNGVTTGTNGEVRALLYDGSGVYVGGLFTSPRAHLAYFDGVDWFGVGSPFNDTVYALAEDANWLYAGGLFSSAGSTAVNRIARISLTSLGDWQPMGSSLDGSVVSLTWSGRDLIAGGRFTSSGLTGVSHIARWDTKNEVWLPLGSGTNDDVKAVAANNNEIFAVGLFTTAGGKESDAFARWALYPMYLPTIRH
jgi:hypothetical protein